MVCQGKQENRGQIQRTIDQTISSSFLSKRIARRLIFMGIFFSCHKKSFTQNGHEFRIGAMP
jgi:hypothetical protein